MYNVTEAGNLDAPAATNMVVYPHLDLSLSVLCFIVFVLGVPGNISALIYFISRGRDLPTRLYTLLSLIDSMICTFILPVGVSLASNRDPMMFNWGVLCTCWGAIWTWAPYMSVFLIAILSITRTMVLLNPLRRINKTAVIVIVVLYGIWIAIRTVTPMVLEGPYYHYLNHTTECMWQSDIEVWNNVSLITLCIFLALPVVPILLSCILSSYVLSSSIKETRNSTYATAAKRNATLTIVILTATYLTFNFPLFLYLATFSVYYIGGNMAEWLGGSTTMDNYIWTAVYIIFIGLNSLANFTVYFTRIKQFRSFIIQFVQRKKRINAQTVCQPEVHISPTLSLYKTYDIRTPNPTPKISVNLRSPNPKGTHAKLRHSRSEAASTFKGPSGCTLQAPKFSRHSVASCNPANYESNGIPMEDINISTDIKENETCDI